MSPVVCCARTAFFGHRHVPQDWICDSLDVRRCILAGSVDAAHSSGEHQELRLDVQGADLAEGYKTMTASLGVSVRLESDSSKAPIPSSARQPHALLLSGGQLAAVLQRCAADVSAAVYGFKCECGRLNSDFSSSTSSCSCSCRSFPFVIRRCGVGRYHGFMVEGVNHRFLLSDFTVTHNTTLIKLITGELQPKEGVVWLNPAVSVAVFTQHHVDQLDLGLTPVELLRTLFPGTEIESCRRHLGRFGLGHDWSLIQIGNLSGGQKSRLAFAIMTWKCPHLIIMDEPTNHLDMETIDVLIDACNRFGGAVITVSHDQFYLTRTVKKYWAVGRGTVKVFDNLDDCKRFSYK